MGGGIIVLFIYICRLISRMKIFIKNLYLNRILILLGVFFSRLFLINYLPDYSLCFFTFNLSPICSKSRLRILISVAAYLIFILIVRVKLCQKFKGGLKSKIYSHIGFILLILEVRSCILIVLILFLIFKSLIDFRFFFFFLCLIVGEARLGLSLIVFRSRIYRKELKILTLL